MACLFPRLIRTAAWFVFCGLAAGALAQTPPAESPLKEVEVAANAFSLGDAVPAWVEPAVMPEADKTRPIIIRLADTQIFVDTTPVVYIHFALTVNDLASLTAAGQLPIPFVPEYQRLRLHAVHVNRGQERLDRTSSSTVRFLRREAGLEQGVYSDVVTASVLVDDLRVGDTLEYSYSVSGQNPVFAGKFVDTATWDQTSPALLRRLTISHPAGRAISWRVVGADPARPLVPKETVAGGTRKLEFEEKAIKEIVTEPYTPPDYMAHRWIQFSEFSA